MKTAVLFLIFNRPDTTRRVFEAIRAARPARLYVAADGPRVGRPDDVRLCEEARKVAVEVDWPCQVKTLFRETNLGCKRGPSGGIDWLFENEEDGIILEDDVLPLESFFPFCEELLERYRHRSEIAMISGCNFVERYIQPTKSYMFIRYGHTWGWATWRRSWKDYDGEMQEWPLWKQTGALRLLSENGRRFEAYWRSVFDGVFSGEIDNAWDYAWQFACWRNSRLSIQPSVNLTENIGFRVDGTHTTSAPPDHVRESRPTEMTFPLRHPECVIYSKSIDSMIDKKVFGITRWSYLLGRIKRIPFVGDVAKKLATSLRAALK